MGRFICIIQLAKGKNDPASIAVRDNAFDGGRFIGPKYITSYAAVWFVLAINNLLAVSRLAINVALAKTRREMQKRNLRVAAPVFENVVLRKEMNSVTGKRSKRTMGVTTIYNIGHR